MLVQLFLLAFVSKAFAANFTQEPYIVQATLSNFDFSSAILKFDPNNDAVVTPDEFVAELKNWDLNNDSLVEPCELTTYALKVYNFPRFIADNLFDVIAGPVLAVPFDAKQFRNLTGFDLNHDGVFDRSELIARLQKRLRLSTRRGWDNIVGPVSNRLEVEVTYKKVLEVINHADTNKNGYIEPDDAIFLGPTNRCTFVRAHMGPIFGVGSHWFYNRVFTVVDYNSDDMMYKVDVLKMAKDADENNDGRATVKEFADGVYAYFSSARWLGGVKYTYAHNTCSDQPIRAARGDVNLLASDVDLNNNGWIEPKEIRTVFIFDVDWNGDGLLDIAEFIHKGTTRYGMTQEQAKSAFSMLDTNQDKHIKLEDDFRFFREDTNKDGRISYCELRGNLVQLFNTAYEQSLRNII